MRQANPLWGAARIHGELQKLGIDVAQATVAKYLRRRSDPPSQSWRTFLTITPSSSPRWTSSRSPPPRSVSCLCSWCCPQPSPDHPRERHGLSDDRVDRATAPRGVAVRHRPALVIRDRDAVYGSDPRRTLRHMGIEEVVAAPRCGGQNPFVESVTGSLRREYLDHVIMWNERALRRHRHRYLTYDHGWRTDLSLDKDAPSLGRPNRQPVARSSRSTRRRLTSPLERCAA